MRVDYAIVFVGDMSRSVAFYRDVLGLRLKFETSHWTEFATEGATLALHATTGGSAGPAAGAGGGGEGSKGEPAGRCRPGLSTPNLDEFHGRMIEKGVRCVQEPKETFGARIAQYLDPDGLVISVSERKM
ncbi:MAG: VOC family protein [Candidatus Eiseniibacteriota bacterium]